MLRSFFRAGVTSALLVLAAPPLLAQETPAPSEASCRTFDLGDMPAMLFTPGDQVVVVGEGFEPRSSVEIRFVQYQTVDLAATAADRAGRLTTGGQVVRIPDLAVSGAAAIELVGEGTTARCPTQVLEAAVIPVAEPQSTAYLALWGFGLMMFGTFLATLSLRRWRAHRLAVRVDGAAVSEQIASATAYLEDDAVDEELFAPPAPPEDDEPASTPATFVPAPVTFEPEEDDDMIELAGVSSTVAQLMRETRGWKARDRRRAGARA